MLQKRGYGALIDSKSSYQELIWKHPGAQTLQARFFVVEVQAPGGIQELTKAKLQDSPIDNGKLAVYIRNLRFRDNEAGVCMRARFDNQMSSLLIAFGSAGEGSPM